MKNLLALLVAGIALSSVEGATIQAFTINGSLHGSSTTSPGSFFPVLGEVESTFSGNLTIYSEPETSTPTSATEPTSIIIGSGTSTVFKLHSLALEHNGFVQSWNSSELTQYFISFFQSEGDDLFSISNNVFMVSFPLPNNSYKDTNSPYVFAGQFTNPIGFEFSSDFASDISFHSRSSVGGVLDEDILVTLMNFSPLGWSPGSLTLEMAVIPEPRFSSLAVVFLVASMSVRSRCTKYRTNRGI